ncbi:MAG: hypothetical protein GY699_05215 [Desulfobacteraceae bacterium]|nr:hypothetical protein [Desulfobacteraceae bacterium]
MDFEKLKSFFMWCTIINGAVLILSTLACIIGQDLVYSIQGKLFHISRENFNMAFFSFIGLFKIAWLIFNLTPYIAIQVIRER